MAAAAAVSVRARSRLRPPGTTVVAVAGPVAVGKSTLAGEIAGLLRAAGSHAEVVSTDGFLLPMRELESRGIAARKGFPESYDVDALRRMLDSVREAAVAVQVPVYSHETYDIVVGESYTVARADVLVLEGVNALSATAGLVDLGVYVDAPVAAIEGWYVERFVRLCLEAEPGSFYARYFSGMDRPELESAAAAVYRSVNLPNLRDHIAPSRARADVVIEKRADHGLDAVVDHARH